VLGAHRRGCPSAGGSPGAACRRLCRASCLPANGCACAAATDGASGARRLSTSGHVFRPTRLDTACAGCRSARSIHPACTATCHGAHACRGSWRDAVLDRGKRGHSLEVASTEKWFAVRRSGSDWRDVATGAVTMGRLRNEPIRKLNLSLDFSPYALDEFLR